MENISPSSQGNAAGGLAAALSDRLPAVLPSGDSIRIYLSLYKVQANIYLLDFQKTDGNPFDFMALCARIITELKALSQV